MSRATTVPRCSSGVIPKASGRTLEVWVGAIAVEADPFGLPVRRGKEAHGPGSDFAPRRGLALLVPRLNFPESLRPGGERFAFIWDMYRLIRGDGSGIREVTGVLAQFLLGRGDQDAVCGLAESPGSLVDCRQLPAQGEGGRRIAGN